MSALLEADFSSPAAVLFPGLVETPQWYVLHTLANHEKRVAQHMQRLGIEHFLPLYRSVRRWSDRKKELHLPLFAGYLFVHTRLGERPRIVQAPGVVQLVSFQGKPAAVAETEIEFLRGTLREGVCVEPYPYLKLGRRVRVHSGPLAGMEGFLAGRKGRLRVVLSLDLIQRAIAAEVGADEIEPAGRAQAA